MTSLRLMAVGCLLAGVVVFTGCKDEAPLPPLPPPPGTGEMAPAAQTDTMGNPLPPVPGEAVEGRCPPPSTPYGSACMIRPGGDQVMLMCPPGFVPTASSEVQSQSYTASWREVEGRYPLVCEQP
jgi:hypothetical protein